MSEKLQRFIALMKKIFELDKSDLDFGIYRIMNIRKAEIEKFLNEDLAKKVEDTLSTFALSTIEIEKRIAAIEKTCNDVGVDVASSKMADEYASLNVQIATGMDITALETDVYSALYSFFNRYYDDGDFISKRRYKEGVYAIPYEGEEVKLYWANQDQYYIKTTENFKDYSFKDNERTIHFRIVDATTEQNNNKEAKNGMRTFMLYNETEEHPEIKTIQEAENELIIRFVFDVPTDKKKNYKDDNFQKISTAIVSQHKRWLDLLRPISTNDPKKPKALVEKHLDAYVAKNTFDYFIHKDLHGFLSRELDFYIKSEIIHLDDLDTTNEKRVETYLAKVRAIRRVGKIIIDFLAQIENFQKKLWLKRKFVISSDWCITLDKINEIFFLEIIANTMQVQEWIDMYSINEIEGSAAIGGYSKPLTLDFLKKNLNLIVDTKYFSNDFKDRLLASFDNLDKQTDGLMVRSENFQALRLLAEKYREKFNCIYIDPPYNTDASKIPYKNNYEHSSWLAMMNDRLNLGKTFLKKDGVQATAIDEYELKELYSLLQDTFSRENNGGIIAIRSNPSGRPRVDGLALSHEYTIISKNSLDSKIVKIGRSEVQANRFDKIDKDGVYEQRNFRREGSNSDRANGVRQWYPIYVDKATLDLRVPDMNWDAKTELWTINEILLPNEEIIYPITDDGIEKNWRWSWENVKKDYSQFYAKLQKSGIQVYYKYRPNEEGITPLTFWEDTKYSSVENGTKLLKEILPNNPFKYPKSIYAVEDMLIIMGLKNGTGCVLDFFAGSATTGHAVINLNRYDGGNRKYLLVDMGEYFNSVTVARVKKVIYSPKWKLGKPLCRDKSVSQIMKYIRLESYEDALSNIALSEERHQLSTLFGEEYLINYMLDIEAEGSILKLDCFKTPFDYKLKINDNNEIKEMIIDIAETFNYLLGLSIVRQSTVTYYMAKPDVNGTYEGAVYLVNNVDGEFAFRRIEGTLPDGRRALIIWRNITDNLITSNAALDAYFAKYMINTLDRNFDVVFINGDNNLANLRTDEEIWKINITEIEFKKRMFEEA